MFGIPKAAFQGATSQPAWESRPSEPPRYPGVNGIAARLAPWAPWRAWLLALLGLCCCPRPSLAAVISNVIPVNVTPTSFSILWRTAPSTPSIAIFSDPGGLTNLSGQFLTDPQSYQWLLQQKRVEILDHL